MNARAGGERLARWSLETGLALLVAAGIYFIWPRLALPRLGREEVWFCLGWLIILVGPSTLGALVRRPPEQQGEFSFPAEPLSHATFLTGGLFVAFLLAGGELGNYKLWLGLVYLGGVSLRLVGLSLGLREVMAQRGPRDVFVPLSAAAISALACLLIIPWVRPDLVAFWPPQPAAAVRPLAAALMWGALSGSLLLLLRLSGAGRRGAWLTFLAVGLGPGPALAVTWFHLLHLGLALVVVGGAAVLRLLVGRAVPAPAPPGNSRPMSLYWLLRAMMLLWWGVGATCALAAAWWQPHLASLFSHSLWLRALLLGGFLVASVGILVEFSLPLLGRPETPQGGQRKVLGVLLSSLAVVLSLAPLGFVAPHRQPLQAQRLLAQSRAQILPAIVLLGPRNTTLEIPVPAWANGLSRVLVVSHLIGAKDVAQGEPVAQLVAVDDSEVPHIFTLRAGIDTAEYDLNKQDVATVARHRAARVARSWMVYTPTGEAFWADSYYTALFLGREVNRLETVTLRYLYHNPPDRTPVRMEVRAVYLY